MDAKLKKELRTQAKLLSKYKEQLEARHKSEPLKSPPVFLFNEVISNLERLTK